MKNMDTKVSIVVPTYNGADYIDDCLNSILNQTYSCIEAIIVDDGSTDETQEVLKRYKDNPKIKVVVRSNGGLSAARNSGVAVATGEWICFVDVDDTIHPELIERMLAVPGRAQCDILVYDWRNVTPEDKNTFADYDDKTEVVSFESAFDYYMDNALSVSACRSLYKAFVIRHHKFLEGVRYEDFDFTMRLLRKIKKGVHVKWPAYNYVQTRGSIIRSPVTLDKFRDMVAVLRHVAEDYGSVQDGRFRQVRRYRIGDTVKKMILKPLAAVSGDNKKMRQDTMRMVGSLIRDGVLAISSLSVHWWPTLLYARILCGVQDWSCQDRSRKLPVYWCARRPNFGDSVTPFLASFLLHRRIEWSVKWKTRVLTIGSVLGVALFKDQRTGFAGYIERIGTSIKRCIYPKVLICGAGFISNPSGNEVLIRRHTKVYAVRGRMTAQALIELGELKPDEAVAFGDPGILFDRLWSDITWTGKNSGVRAFVPHECYWEMPWFESFMAKHPELVYIDVRHDPREVFLEISKAAEIFSSSLHGLVAADALGIPNRWVDLRLDGKDDAYRRYKFDDYYSAYGARRDPIPLEDVPYADVGEQLQKTTIDEVKGRLLEAFDRLAADL